MIRDRQTAEDAEDAEGQAELEAMRSQHPAPCRFPDSPDCTCPTPGDLAEQRHLVDPLDDTLTHLADQTPATSACNTCGDTPEMWCPSCAACRKGCDGGLIDNPCTHPNAPWQVTS